MQETTLPIGTRNIEIPASSHFVDEQILSRKAYTTSYNCNTKCPNWVAWHLTSEHTDGPFPRNGVPYYSNNGIVEGIGYVTQETCRNGYFVDIEAKEPRQLLSDWTRDYNMSHGHMCPAGDCKWDSVAMAETNLLTNICPQESGLNSGMWNQVEQACRRWAISYGHIYIVCGPLLYRQEHLTIGDHKVVVPEAFFKVILRLGDDPACIGYVMKNGARGKKKSYVNTLSQVERITGYQFFPNLADSIRSQIEDLADESMW